MFQVTGQFGGREVAASWDAGRIEPDWVAALVQDEMDFLREQGRDTVSVEQQSAPVDLGDDLFAVWAFYKVLDRVRFTGGRVESLLPQDAAREFPVDEPTDNAFASHKARKWYFANLAADKATGGGGGKEKTKSRAGGPQGAPPGRLEDMVYQNPKHKTAAEMHGKTPADASGKPIPVKTKKMYHVTTREGAEKILREGFDLSKVKPRWRNDYAVSLGGSAKGVRLFFTRGMGRSGAKLAERVKKYPFPKDKVILEVEVKGRFGDMNQVSQTVGASSSPQDYTSRAARAGYDAAGNSATTYVYNPQAIRSIRVVPDPFADLIQGD